MRDVRLDEFRSRVLARGTELYRDLPWRRTHDPYAVWVSEAMLQQTQVVRVDGRWQRWLERFPTVDALAAASSADVLEEWQGLGYNRRAIALLHGFGGVVVFDVKGGREAGLKVVDNVRLFTHLANVGDAKSLIIHPASTTHSQLTAEQLQAAHLSEDLIRLSVGIEDVDDIIADLDQALARI